MNVREINNHLRSSAIWRSIGVIVSVWIASVLFLAAYTAHAEGVEVYQWPLLPLLLVGVPVASSFLAYAISLMSRTVRIILIVLIAIVPVVITVGQVLEKRQAAIEASEEAALMAPRAARKIQQDQEDLERYGSACTSSCSGNTIDKAACVTECSQNRGDAVRRATWRLEGATCATKCAADPNPYCEVVCEMPD